MGKVILIADSGTTKTDWSVVVDGSLVHSINTKGMNPYFQTYEEIKEEIENVLMPQLADIFQVDGNSRTGESSQAGGVSIDAIYFYGAGCIFDKVDIMREAISSCINAPLINIYSDLLAAAHSTCGGEAGIACIMGTGSNSCFYDGRNIVKNVPSLGFILGDEGGGVALGRSLVSDVLKGILPPYLINAFFERFKLTQAEILDNVYKRSFPNRFLASLSPFLSEHIEAPEIRAIACNSFISFLTRNVKQYDCEKYVANFVGSIAYHYKDVLMEAAETVKVRVGKIIKSPMSGLITMHTKKSAKRKKHSTS